MTKSKNIEYENGMKFKCGPPLAAGGYAKWNWCKLCDSIYDKSINRCQDCGQMVRASSKNKFGTDAKNGITKADRARDREKVITSLSIRAKALYTT